MFSLLFAAALSNEAVETFVQRVAEPFAPRGTIVAIGALPQGWSSTVPLPEQIRLLGSMKRGDGTVNIYYQPQNAASSYNTYAQRLQSAGFAAKPIEVPFSRGFVETTAVPERTLFCRGGDGVNVRVVGKAGDDMRVDVLPQDSTLNRCGASPQTPPHISNPLPDLYAPPGVTVTQEGGSMNASFAVNGIAANVTYAALLQGNIGATPLLKDYVSQFSRAGWKTTSASYGTNAGFANVSQTINGQTWNALLTIYPSDRPNAYHANLSAAGKPVQLRAPKEPKLPMLPASLAKSQTPLLLDLVKRVLNSNGPGQTSLLIGKRPNGLPPSMPIPEGRLLGSTVTVANVEGGSDVITLYLDVTKAQFQAYESQLHQAGWLGQSWTARGIGGFQSAPGSEPVVYCKQSQQPITVMAQPGTNAVAVSFERNPVANACRPFPVPPSFGLTLPNIVAPSRSIHRWTSGQSTGVSFESTTGPSAVLDDFAKQMTAQGWTPSPAISNDTAATQTFTRTDSKRGTLRAVLTIYRAAKSNTYSAILDVT